MRVTTVTHPAYRWALVGMLWFVCFFNYADRQAVFSIFPLLRNEFHLSTVQLGIVGSSFMWMYALFGPFAGWLCDRAPRKAIVLGALIFWSLVTAMTAATGSYPQLVACRALGGLGEAFYFPACMSLIADYHSAATRSRAMALHQSSVYAGSIAGGAASGYLGQVYGWRPAFVIFGVLGIGLGVLLWAFIREPVRGAADDVGILEAAEDAMPVAVRISASTATQTGTTGWVMLLRDFFSNPLFLTLIAVFVGANFVAVVFLAWLPTFLFEKFHMSLAAAGFNGTAFLQVSSVVGVLCGGLLADLIVKRSTRRKSRSRMLVQAIGLLSGVPFLFLVGQTRVVPVLLTMLVGFGFFKGLYDANLWASLYDVIPLRRRGAAVGWMNSLGWLGGGSAPVLIALLAHHFGMSIAISATAGIYLLCGAGLFAVAVH